MAKKNVYNRPDFPGIKQLKLKNLLVSNNLVVTGIGRFSQNMTGSQSAIFYQDVHIGGNLSVVGTSPDGGASPWTDGGGKLYSTSSVVIGTGSYATDLGTDTFMFVSGTSDSRGTATRGTTVFGGDTHASGSISSDGSVVLGGYDGRLYLSGSGGTSQQIYGYGNDLYIQNIGLGGILFSGDSEFYGSLKVQNQDVTFNEYGNSGVTFRTETDNLTHALYVDGTTDQVGIGVKDSTEWTAASALTDMNFYVSGTVGSRGTAVKGTTVFGGDVHVSGTLTASNLSASADLETGGDLSVSGTMFVKTTRSTTADNQPLGVMNTTGEIVVHSSDRRIKEGFEEISQPLEKVKKLHGTYYSPKLGYGNTDNRYIGFIAQEVEEVVPELVFTNLDSGLKGVRYTDAVALLTEAIKEMADEIDRLRSLVEEK